MPRQSSRCLYEDAEFKNQNASEYKEFDCLGTYDTLSEIGEKSANLSAEEWKSNCD